MGSPYFVHTVTQNVSVVRTERGFLRILESVLGTMGIWECADMSSLASFRSVLRIVDGPANEALESLLQSFYDAQNASARTVVFLGACYEWRGSDKFQRVIVFDFTKKTVKAAPPSV